MSSQVNGIQHQTKELVVIIMSSVIHHDVLCKSIFHNDQQMCNMSTSSNPLVSELQRTVNIICTEICSVLTVSLVGRSVMALARLEQATVILLNIWTKEYSADASRPISVQAIDVISCAKRHFKIGYFTC